MAKRDFFCGFISFKARFFRFLVNSSLFKRTPLFSERIAYTVTPEAIAQSLCRWRERLEDRMRDLELLQCGAAAAPILPGNDAQRRARCVTVLPGSHRRNHGGGS
jgi:hypothetical protein